MRDQHATSTIWDVRVGQALKFDSLGVKVEVVYKSGQFARLRVVAPADVVIQKSLAEVVTSVAN